MTMYTINLIKSENKDDYIHPETGEILKVTNQAKHNVFETIDEAKAFCEKMMGMLPADTELMRLYVPVKIAPALESQIKMRGRGKTVQQRNQSLKITR
ncbi:hypothetical protein LGH93_004190 [Salmonella enterica subsp. enterica serovar Telelkebir]|nr:hypothetical protein [Salmonella enterica]EIH3027309.1 hypothetical protein [Salmonella enterica subsp. enterica serovar Telelkebir]